MKFRRVGPLALLVLLAQSPAAAHGWTTISSPGFAYCLARAQCDPEGPDCIDEELAPPPTGCSIICDEPDTNCSAGAYANPQWSIYGFVERVIPDVPPGTRLNAQGELISAQQFVVSGDFSYQPFVPGSAEIAVVRFAGDPAALLGRNVRDLADMVERGLIQPGDVVFSETFYPEDFGQVFSFEVDVTGVPPDEIVLFSSGRGPDDPGLPFLAGRALIGLAVGLLATVTILVLKR